MNHALAGEELSVLEAERRAIAAHGEGLAGLYAWLSQQPDGRPPGVVLVSGSQTTEGAP